MKKKLKISALAIAVCAILTGCQKTPELKECWSDSAKSSLMNLARNDLGEKIETLVLLSKNSSNQENIKEFINNALKLSIDTYHVVSRNFDAESLSCGANVSMEYTRADGSVMKAANASIIFSIYKAESGNVYSLDNPASLGSLLTRAK